MLLSRNNWGTVPPLLVVDPVPARFNVVLIAAFLILAIPTMVILAQQSWSTEAGAHGPIVLATGLWLLWNHGVATVKDLPNGLTNWLIVGILIVVIGCWAFGRAFDLLLLEAGGLFAVALVLWSMAMGWRSILANAFPFAYLAFLIPIPGWVLNYLTAPLQQLVSGTSTAILRAFDYPIFREGVVITVGQYQLLVEDACAGMNSLMGLISISMFYIYLLYRSSWRYALLLLALVIPIAIFVNILRVVVLVLLTYHSGNAVAQGFMHVTAGMVLFAVALGLMVAVDNGLRALFHRTERRTS